MDKKRNHTQHELNLKHKPMAAPTFASELGKCKYTDLLNDVKHPNIYIEKLPSSKLFTTFAIDFLN